jgi:ribulose-5-phosphate 4-epimerase/fuculose-1-phosphate aldolase
MTLTDQDRQNYVDLCVFLGSFKELIQGSGGNISVKSDSKSQLMIKSSGRVLAETTPTSGYVMCDISLLQKAQQANQENVKHTVLSNQGGDVNGLPSMEVFFHLLPSKWVVHLHPVRILSHVCQIDWKTPFDSPNHSSLFVPYKTPGLELSTYILKHYCGQTTILLQNHGLILCGDTIEGIIMLLDSFYKTTHDSFLELFRFQQHVRQTTGQPFLLKPCNHIHSFYERFFMPITPDITLFLKRYPLAQETKESSLEQMFDDYRNLLKTEPSVIRSLHSVYVLGKSYRQCVNIEEILESYIAIMKLSNPNTIHFFESDSVTSLQTSEKEVHRMNIV